MGALGPLASLLGIETEELMRQVREQAVAFAAIGLFVLIAVAFLLVGADIVLAAWIGPLWAALAIAGVALLIALILFVALRIQQAAAKKQREARRGEISTLVTSAAISALPELLASPLVRNVGVPVALYAAVLLLARPKRASRPPASD